MVLGGDGAGRAEVIWSFQLEKRQMFLFKNVLPSTCSSSICDLGFWSERQVDIEIDKWFGGMKKTVTQKHIHTSKRCVVGQVVFFLF